MWGDIPYSDTRAIEETYEPFSFHRGFTRMTLRYARAMHSYILYKYPFPNII